MTDRSDNLYFIFSFVLGGLPFWKFLDFVVSHRSPLSLLLTPFIKFRLVKSPCESGQEYFLHQMIQSKSKGVEREAERGRASMLVELVAELRGISSELSSQPGTNTCDKPPRMLLYIVFFVVCTYRAQRTHKHDEHNSLGILESFNFVARLRTSAIVERSRPPRTRTATETQLQHSRPRSILHSPQELRKRCQIHQRSSV